MIRFYVNERQEDTCLVIEDDRDNCRHTVEAAQLNELRRAVNKALKNIGKYSDKPFALPHSEFCWVVGDTGLPCLKSLKTCEHRNSGLEQHPERLNEELYRQELAKSIRTHKQAASNALRKALGRPQEPRSQSIRAFPQSSQEDAA